MTADRSAFWRLLGLATRARKVITGSDAVEIGLRREKGFLLILAEDMAPNGADKLKRIADARNITVISCGTREDMGHWTGKFERVAILIADKGFADRLLELHKLQKDPDIEANI